ncbi:response regulator [Cryobacterium psychrophilum]|uniref:Response regulator transcription factor n=1 Tax=Cryobacterium psychrophilum TaxID=41988 RepID=A0A4Y8KKJ1_9MICO|nr:response regulator transcription factor [Cryobacterium psychrophilum]TDW30668.1 LuxR family two component transcriptional regulator [Cryobacterium psychrophilum]TFD77085.1 response regulator transcription factor [Cryobacterium psychrophilum]
MTQEATETPASDQKQIRVAIVDDHESVQLGLKGACENSGYTVIFTAATVRDLVTGLAGRVCDVIVLDLALGDGSVVTDNVKLAQSTGSAVLVHSIADRVASVREALAAGAAGVIPKSSPTATVMAAVAAVAHGDVLNNLEWATAIDADRDFAKAQLGRRERDVLHLYASGLPLKMVALQLGIAHSTAREYLDRIRVKYVEVGRPAPTKVDLLRRAVEDGILPGLDTDAADGRV